MIFCTEAGCEITKIHIMKLNVPREAIGVGV